MSRAIRNNQPRTGNPRPLWVSGFLLLGTTLLAQPTTDEGYYVPRDEPVFSFPRDHGSHPGYRIEWWYLVHHLTGDNGQRYGLQATFFRSARTPPSQHSADPDAIFDDDQLYLAHMALAEIDEGRYRHEERLNRSGWNAGASTETMDVVNGNWRLWLRDPTPDAEELELRGSISGEITFSLSYQNTKPLTKFGQNGLSRKGDAPDARSYYLTFTRLAASGTLTIDGAEVTVTGSGWLDHEISSGQLADNQVGWNWTGVQLDDGREIMAFILRRDDGSIDPFSVLYVVDEYGNTTEIPSDGFTWTNLRTWTSPDTGGAYPIEVVLTAPGPGLHLHLIPLLDEAELGGGLGGIDYWEGPMEVRNESGARIGQAYLELTGYSEDVDL